MIHSTERAIFHLCNILLVSKLIDMSLGLPANFLTPEDLIVRIMRFGRRLVVYRSTLLNCLRCLKSPVNNVLVYLLLISSILLTIIQVL